VRLLYGNVGEEWLPCDSASKRVDDVNAKLFDRVRCDLGLRLQHFSCIRAEINIVDNATAFLFDLFQAQRINVVIFKHV
jgi:hypothetical protein